MLVPVMKISLKSAQKLTASIFGLLDSLWESILLDLTQMTPPIRFASQGPLVSPKR